MAGDVRSERRRRRRATPNHVYLYRTSEGAQMGIVHIPSGPDILLSAETVSKLERKRPASTRKRRHRPREAKPSVQEEKILPKMITNGAGMCGWMHRKGDLALSAKLEHGQVCSKLKWTSYYFVADSTAKMLLQFKSKQDRSAKDLILLDGAKVLAVGAVRLFTTVYAFKISQRSGRVVYLACEDEEACQSWMRLLRSIVHGKRAVDKIQEKIEDSAERKSERVAVNKAAVRVKEMRLFDGTKLTDELKKGGMAVLPIDKLGLRSDDERVETEPWLLVSSEHAAALLIQGQYRMFVAKQRLRLRRTRKDAAVRVQAFMRRLIAQRQCEKLLSEIKAAVTVQSSWRMHKDFLVYKTRLMQLRGATALQKTWLMYRVRALYVETRQAYARAVTAFVGGICEDGKTYACLQLLEDIDYAVTQIQAKQRMITVRGEYVEIQRNLKAIKLQRFLRRNLNRRQAQKWRRHMLHMHYAAESIAMAWRRHRLSTRISQRLERKAACVDIQRHMRGRLARDRAKVLRKELEDRIDALRSCTAVQFLEEVCVALWARHCATCTVQRRVRSYLIRCEFVAARNHQLDLTRCAQRIQGIARGHLFRKELSHLGDKAARIQSVARRYLARKALVRLRVERRHSIARRIQRWYKHILGWRFAMIQQEQESYRFGSAGVVLKQTVIVNGSHWGVRSQTLDSCATIYLSIMDLTNLKHRIKATFSGWTVVRLLQTQAHRCFTLKQLAALLCRSLVLNEMTKLSECITPEPFKRFLRAQTAHAVTMTSITKALETTARIPLRSSEATEYDDQKNDNTRLEILQSVGKCSGGALKKEWESRLAQIFFHLQNPLAEVFCFQPFERSIVSAMASHRIDVWVRDATKRVAQLVSNTFGVRMDAQKTVDYSVDHALFVHRQHGVTFEECTEIQSRIYERLAEEIQRGSTAVKDLHAIVVANDSERRDLDGDIQR